MWVGGADKRGLGPTHHWRPSLACLHRRQRQDTAVVFTRTSAKEPELVETMSADEDLAKLRCVRYPPTPKPGDVAEAARNQRLGLGLRQNLLSFCLRPLCKGRPRSGEPRPPVPLPVRHLPSFLSQLRHESASPLRGASTLQNVAGGLCAVLKYGEFDSTKSRYLVFHDLRLPMPALPSSRLAHSNVSLGVTDS